MSNTPFFDKLISEYEEKQGKEILHTLSHPFMSHPLAFSSKPPLPKRTAAEIIREEMFTGPYSIAEDSPMGEFVNRVLTPDLEIARQVQEFIHTAPMKLLEGTPAGSFIKSIDSRVTDDGDYIMEAEVMVPPQPSQAPQGVRPPTPNEEIVNAGQLPVPLGFQGVRPTMMWVDEWGCIDPEDEEVYIAEHKTENVPEDLAERQLDLYRSASPFFRQKAAQTVMTPANMPSWIKDEVELSNDTLSDPEPQKTDQEVYSDFVKAYASVTPMKEVALSDNISLLDLEKAKVDISVCFKDLVEKFHEKYPKAMNLSIHREEELDGTTTISVTGTTPEQTDESVNAAPNNVRPTTVQPLWVSNEE